MTRAMENPGNALVRVADAYAAGAAERRYVNLDNAATTPAAADVLSAVEAFLRLYGSIHRGAGLKSVVSTELYEGTFEVVRRFVKADQKDAVVVTWNTTTAINRLAARLAFRPEDVVVLSEIEHSSNVLPWRKYARVVTFRCSDDGRVDLEDLEAVLRAHSGSARLVAVTGASNVTGYLPPLQDIALLAHRFGAEVFVDAAQLAPHRPIQMRHPNPDLDIDYVAFSGHKMYAPFGAGVLVGRRRAFDSPPPDLPGGGTVEMVTSQGQIWAGLPASLTPGTPNVVGLVALAAAMQAIVRIGYDLIIRHEQKLLARGLEVLSNAPRVRLYGQQAFRPGDDRLPVFPFTIEGCDHALVAAVLGHEYAIAVRSGHLCQYEFMRRQLAVSDAVQQQVERDLLAADRRSMYGMVRASCGLCTSTADLDALEAAIRELVRSGPRVRYSHDRATGMYLPEGAGRLASTVPEELRFLLPSETPIDARPDGEGETAKER